MEYENYYNGFPDNPRLLARSNPLPWIGHPLQVPMTTFHGGFQQKAIFPIGNHPLKQKLAEGLRAQIREVQYRMLPAFISADYVRIGYDVNNFQNNPVVILISVKKDSLDRAAAQAFVQEISNLVSLAGLEGIDIEIMEGKRIEEQSRRSNFDKRVEILTPQAIPLIGNSISLAPESESFCAKVGTLGGFVKVDGIIYALTNSHVLLDYRVQPFPTPEEALQKTKIIVEQPCLRDSEKEIKFLEKRISEVGWSQEERAIYQKKLIPCKDYLGGKREFGTVYRTSGIRPRCSPKPGRYRVDWGLIALSSSRFPPGTEIYNEVPRTVGEFGDKLETLYEEYGYADFATRRFPSFLKRALSNSEVAKKAANISFKSKQYAVVKHGRTTNWTFGYLNDVKTDYASSTCGGITDELPVVSPEGSLYFSKGGDSGALVFDTEGFVVGLLWGGADGTRMSYITPIEAVLEEIKETCGAENVELCVRDEDREAKFDDWHTDDVVQLPVSEESPVWGAFI